MLLDDKTDSPGQWSWCGPTCTRHALTVSSSVAQTVHLTVNLWEARSYPRECRKRNKYHSIYVEGNMSVDMWRDGSKEVAPIEMEAGQTKSIMIEFDWERECITPDWSIVAWAEKGEVTVTHDDGLKSMELPSLPAAPTTSAETEDSKVETTAPETSKVTVTEKETTKVTRSPAPEEEKSIATSSESIESSTTETTKSN